MALNLYKPEWQNAAPAAFKSNNPLIRGDVILDIYEVEVEEKDTRGEVIGTHTETCVTHNSLLRYYQTYLLPTGVSVKFEIPYINNPSRIVVKCIIEKALTNEEWKTLTSQGVDVPANTVYHIEAIGDADTDNCMTRISSTHLSTTAENRAFDRALVRYLVLDLDGALYSSSDEIGRPVTKAAVENKKQDENWFASANKGTPPKEAPKPAPAKVSANVRPASPVTSAQVNAPAKTGTDRQTPPVKSPAAVSEPAVKPAAPTAKTTQETTTPPTATPLNENSEIAMCAHQTYTDQEYDWMLSQAYQFSKSIFNGRTYRELINVVKEDTSESKEVCVAFYSLLKYKPRHQDQIAVWQRFISYMAKEKLLIVYPSGKVFVGKK